jgi:hypothetical protein
MPANANIRATRTVSRKSHKLTAPAGLRAALSMVRQDSEKAVSPLLTANCIPHAQRVVQILGTTGNDRALADTLKAGAAAMYPGIGDELDAETHAEAAFLIGYAVAWLLMMAVSGKAGAK